MTKMAPWMYRQATCVACHVPATQHQRTVRHRLEPPAMLWRPGSQDATLLPSRSEPTALWLTEQTLPRAPMPVVASLPPVMHPMAGCPWHQGFHPNQVLGGIRRTIELKNCKKIKYQDSAFKKSFQFSSFLPFHGGIRVCTYAVVRIVVFAQPISFKKKREHNFKQMKYLGI